MNESELRALVRESIARHLSVAPPSGPDTVPVAFLQHHASHGQFLVPSGADADGPCIIEPSVMCTHCGYCKSLGH